MCDSFVMPKTTTPELIGSAAAADRLNIDRSTLTRWVKSHKIVPALTGSGKTGEMFFTPASIDALTPPVNSATSPVESAGVSSVRVAS